MVNQALPENKTKNIAAITTISLLILGIIQIILGETISKSVALTANGIDCIGDAFVSGIVWVGLIYFNKPADEKFHFGYYKIENLASIAAAIVMILLAVYISYRSYMQLINPHKVELPILGALVALIAAIVALALGIYKIKDSKKTNLSSAKLDAKNTIKDGTASFLTVAALIFLNFGYPIADAIVGFIIAGIIVTIGFAAIKESSHMLVDACDGSCIEQSQSIKEIVENFEEVFSSHVVRLRRAGPVLQGEIEIKVDGDMTIYELNILRYKIIDRAKKQFPELERLIVTPIPVEKGKK